MAIRHTVGVFVAVTTLFSIAAAGRDTPLYKNPKAPLEQRVDAWIAQQKSPAAH